MSRVCGWLLVLLTLAGGVAPARAQSSAERHAFSTAAGALTNSLWSVAESGFDDFLHRYPASTLRPDAVLFQAEARFQLGDNAGAISLLTTNLAGAGTRLDNYLDQLAGAYLADTNYAKAAEMFARIAVYFPNSPLRFKASVGQADALARLAEWPRVIELLQSPDGVFQSLAASHPGDLAARGYLLLGEAEFMRGDLAAAAATVQLLAQQKLPPELAWRRWYLQCRVELAGGFPQQAQDSATNLAALAGATGQAALQADTASFQGRVFKQLERYADAIAAFQKNLGDNVPAARQREALLSIADLSLAQGQTVAAVQTLDTFLAAHTNSPQTDAALLALGELKLRLHLSNPTGAVSNATPGVLPAPDLLHQALTNFDTILDRFPDSEFVGKALLDKGWCLWTAGDMQHSRDAFEQAVSRLAPSEDQATALFKLGDAQFALNDYAGASAHYRVLINSYAGQAEVKSNLIEPALYQWFRAALNVPDLEAATNALGKILTWYPDGFAGPQALLMAGQGLLRGKDPAAARAQFQRFERLYPTSPLLPEVRLATARTYEAEGNWAAAITHYQNWTNTFPANPGLAGAQYELAWANFMAGRETNALMLFTNFVGRFRANALAPRAQWWVADYYFRQGAFQTAEGEYQKIFLNTNWPVTELSYQAQMMAGRTAMARGSPADAIGYFTNLTSNPTYCPPHIFVQALFAYGDALASQAPADTLNETNRSKVSDAIAAFKQISSVYPTNDLVPDAWGRIGDCYQELGASQYPEALKAYQLALAATNASAAVLSQARVGLGMVTEKQADLATGTNRVALLRLAVQHYEAVLVDSDLREGQTFEPFWVQVAGLAAARVAEEKLDDWPQALHVYKLLEQKLPVPPAVLQDKIRRARDQLAKNRVNQ